MDCVSVSGGGGESGLCLCLMGEGGLRLGFRGGESGLHLCLRGRDLVIV